MLEIILAALGAFACLGYIFSSAANEQTYIQEVAKETIQKDAHNVAA
ncbi:MAG: hypothetical protein RR814_02435 [Oscillospiraceae bacterium]